MPTFLIQFAQWHEAFRLPELLSILRALNVEYKLNTEDYDDGSPFLKIQLKSWEEAKRVVCRSILIRSIYELFADGANYDKVIERAKLVANERIAQLGWTEKSWKFDVVIFGGGGSELDWCKSMSDKINQFRFMDMAGPVNLKRPEVRFFLAEDLGVQRDNSLRNEDLKPKSIYLGAFVADSGRSELIHRYDLKTRGYLGITSMDAELSLVMANQALAGPGKLIFDPFVGTGSFLYTCSAFGAYTMGADLDGRQLRGDVKYRNPKMPSNQPLSIQTNVDHYGLQHLVLDLFVCDNKHHPLRVGGIFDAIVTDPPYGVRAGAKTIGSEGKEVCINDADRGKIYPHVVDYELSDLITDLLGFSATYLRIGGRLVYWLPIINEDSPEVGVPLHPYLKLVSSSNQSFGKWSRRLITMERVEGRMDVDLNINARTMNQFKDKFFNRETS